MQLEGSGAAPRAAERDKAGRIYFTLAAVIGGVVSIYFVLVPVFGLNLAFRRFSRRLFP